MTGIARECAEHMNDLVILEEGWDTMGDTFDFTACNSALTKFVQTKCFEFGFHRNDLNILQSRCFTLAEEKERRREELATTGAEIAR